MRILGIDPGSRIVGFAIIERKRQAITYVDSGLIRLKGLDLGDRLCQLSQSLTTLIDEYRPEKVAMETPFLHKNVKSLMALCHARGVIMQQIFAMNLPLYDYEPRLVKKTVVGYGNAKKCQVGHMVRVLLNLPSALAEDAADAAAVALTHCQLNPERNYGCMD